MNTNSDLPPLEIQGFDSALLAADSAGYQDCEPQGTNMPPTLRNTPGRSSKRSNENYEDRNKKKTKTNTQENQQHSESESESDSGSESEREPEYDDQEIESGQREMQSEMVASRNLVNSRRRMEIAHNLHHHDEGVDNNTSDEVNKIWGLTLEDLKPRPKRMPRTPSEVYDQDLRLDNLDDRARVRKVTREIIFPRQKFIPTCNREKKYDHPEEIKPRTMPFKVLKSLSWTGPNTDQVEMAIRWNTYSREVEKTLRQQQSTSISHMKKHYLDGK